MWRTLFIAMTSSGFLTATAWAQNCPSDHTSDQIEARLVSAEKSLKALDSDAFELAMEEVAIMVPCLSDLPSKSQAAKMHRMQGIALYTAGKEDAARVALLAAKLLTPDQPFPKTLFPQGHALPDFWSEIPSADPKHVRAPVPKGATVSFDGTKSRNRPSDRATLFQIQSAQGAVKTTRYLMPTDPLPTYPSIPRQRNRLIAASVISGVVTGASYAIGWQSRQNFMEEDASRTKAELESLKTKVNASFLISGIGATLTVAGVTSAVLIGPR